MIIIGRDQRDFRATGLYRKSGCDTFRFVLDVNPPRRHVNPPRRHVNPPRGHVNPPRGHKPHCFRPFAKRPFAKRPLVPSDMSMSVLMLCRYPSLQPVGRLSYFRDFRLRTNWVDTNGAAAKVMNFDGFGGRKQSTPWHCWEYKNKLMMGVPKMFLCQKKKMQ